MATERVSETFHYQRYGIRLQKERQKQAKRRTQNLHKNGVAANKSLSCSQRTSTTFHCIFYN